MVMLSTQGANALIPAAIKSTRLVANANRHEGISAFPVSPILPTLTTQTRYTNPIWPELCSPRQTNTLISMAVLQVLVQLVTSSG